MTVRRRVGATLAAATALSLLAPITATAAPAGDRSVPVTGPVLSLGETYCTDIAHVNLGLINDILTTGVVDSAIGLLTKGGLIILTPAQLAQYGLVNVDLTNGDPTTAPPVQNLPNNLVAVDLDPVWGLVLDGMPVQQCTNPSMAVLVENDLNDLFKPGQP